MCVSCYLKTSSCWLCGSCSRGMGSFERAVAVVGCVIVVVWGGVGV